VSCEGEAKVADLLKEALAAGAQVIEVSRKRETLEDLFMRRAL
jgi:ABC-2 type transport system ATP-binding protein